jgi:apolipoprotein N-acyltransferase
MESPAVASFSPRAPEAAAAGNGRMPPLARRRGQRGLLLASALLSSALLWAAYFPLNWGFLAWGALVPWLLLLRSRQPSWYVELCAWISGLAFFLPALEWMHAADGLRAAPLGLGPMTCASLFLGIYCSLYFLAAAILLRRLERRRWPLVLTFPAIWTALEWLRSFLGTGFPWYFLGHTQHAFLPLIQIADVGGAYAVTFLVAAGNALLCEWLSAWPPLRSWLGLEEIAARGVRAPLLATLGVAGLVLLALGYGAWRLSQEAFRPGPRLALLQSNLDQRLRNEAALPDPDADDQRRQEARQANHRIIQHLVPLCQEAAAHQPDLIVWPETSFPADFIAIEPAAYQDLLRHLEDDPEARWWYTAHETIRADLRELASRCRTPLLLGLVTRQLVAWGEKPRRYNSALLVTAQGLCAGRYDKLHRVPFGEYLPLRDWLPFMEVFSPYPFDYGIQPGSHLTRLTLPASAPDQPPWRFGVLICFEDSDPLLARHYARPSDEGPPADFLINLSNDGWFAGNREHEQHLAICRFRAIEARRSIARVVNMGISAVIDGSGRVLQPTCLPAYDPDHPEIRTWELAATSAPALPTARWAQFKNVPLVLLATIPLDDRVSLYACWGDWLPVGSSLIALVGLLAPLCRRCLSLVLARGRVTSS